MLVLWVILMGVKLKSMTDVCLFNLAVADLLLVFSLPFLAHYARDSWVFGAAVCFLVLGVYHVGFYGGIFFIVLMSFDRYLAIVHAVFAMRVRTKTTGILASLGVWVASVAVSFPELRYLGIIKHDGKTLCSAYPNGGDHNDMKVIGLFKMNMLGLLVPLAIVGYCYTMVLRRLLKVRSCRKQAIRLVAVVMVVFFSCWTPYNIAAFLKALELKKVLDANCEVSQSIQLMLQATEAIAYSHSCLNPFLYVFVGQKFKNHLIRLLRQTPFSKLQFIKGYMTRATSSVYSQISSVDERFTTL
ncbi:C-C chemokine receptor type 4-like [Trichomycterus rosablanca]|uniref:C-C chemokine receptor type 4-like n=1 Tax=Trichomycterus rosablanca TaxID=2290929 RepID=UPI002F35763E